MEMPLADMLDRLAICLLKKHVGGLDVDVEIKALRAAISFKECPEDWFTRLLIYNALIWSAEADIRKGREGELGMAEVGRRALDIRAFNALRVRCKQEIAQAYGDFPDIKAQHASAPEWPKAQYIPESQESST